MEIVNSTGAALLATRLVFMGYRFHTVPLQDKTQLARLQARQDPSTDVWCTGRSI